MPNHIRQFVSSAPVPKPVNHGVNQPGSTSHPREEAAARQMRSGSSEPRISQNSSLQTTLLAQESSRPKSEKEYLVKWEKWAQKPNQAAGENRTQAVERIRAWLHAGQPDKTLHFDSLGLTSLPELPASLRKLDAANNQLASLPELPDSLLELNVYNNQLTSLSKLPDSLQRLYVSNNQLTSLPELPPSLQRLYVSNNQLTSLMENITATQERGCKVYVDGKRRSEKALNRLHAPAIVNAADYQGSHIHLPSEPALRVPLDSQSDTKPAEQSAASPMKTDEQVLSKPEVRFGDNNLQRFHALHGQADEAGSSWWEHGADEARSSWELGSPQNAGAQANTAAENSGGG